MSHSLCVIAGDGIGPEVLPAAVAVLEKLLPDVRVQASTSNAHPPTISRLITTSVGRCHFPATRDNATSSV